MAWLSGWSKRIKITIDNTNIDSDQDWFPVTIFLGISVGQSSQDISLIFDEVGANSKKIAVTKSDGTTELYVEIEQWDSGNELAVLHVSSAGWTVTAASAAEIYIYYDSSHADNDTYVAGIGARTEVWDSNFKMVQHMVDTTVSTITDSTSNNNDGSKLGDNEPNEVNGKIYKAQDFDGNDDYVDLDVIDITSWSEITISAWINFPDYTAQDILISIMHSGSDDIRVLLESNKIKFITDDGTAVISEFAITDPHENTWIYVTGTYDSSTQKLYINGAVEDSDESSFDFSTANGYANIGVRDGGSYPFTGLIDEVRISATLRLPAWIKATYYSTKDDLLTFGSEETSYIPKVIMVT